MDAGSVALVPPTNVEIYGSGSADAEREAGSSLDVPAHLRSFNARFTNTGTERHASLTVLFCVRLMPGSLPSRWMHS